MNYYVEMLPVTISMTNGYGQLWVSGPDMSRMTPQEQAAHLEKIHQASKDANKAIQMMGAECLPLLMYRLEHRETALERTWEKIYSRTFPLLRRIGITTRVNVLGSRTEVRRWQAVTALMSLRRSDVDLKPLVPRLKTLARVPQSGVRQAARFMLREVDREALERLEQAKNAVR